MPENVLKMMFLSFRHEVFRINTFNSPEGKTKEYSLSPLLMLVCPFIIWVNWTEQTQVLHVLFYPYL